MEAVIDLPTGDGQWVIDHETLLQKSSSYLAELDSVLSTIEKTKELAVRNSYTLEVYEQAARVARFAPHALKTMQEYDEAGPDQKAIARQNMMELRTEFAEIEADVLEVYGKTRVLDKPDNYILDQDHHVHLANQAQKFEDWQFYVEKLFLYKLDSIR
jgi:hypothetical protein